MPPMTNFDFDFAVVGSGFGGSVSALRLIEKGYRVLMLEKGRELGPEQFPEVQLGLALVHVGAAARIPRLVQDDVLPPRHDHVAASASAAVRSPTRARIRSPKRLVLRIRVVGAPRGLEDGARAPLRRGEAHARRDANAGPHAPSTKRCATSPPIVDDPRRSSRRTSPSSSASPARPCPIRSSAARARAHRLHSLRRLHDRLSRRREEHARQELSVASRAERGLDLHADTEVEAVRPAAGRRLSPRSARRAASASSRASLVHRATGRSRRRCARHRRSAAPHEGDPAGLPRLSDRVGRAVRTNSEALVGVVSPARGAAIFRRAWRSDRSTRSTNTRTSNQCASQPAQGSSACSSLRMSAARRPSCDRPIGGDDRATSRRGPARLFRARFREAIHHAALHANRRRHHSPQAVLVRWNEDRA